MREHRNTAHAAWGGAAQSHPELTGFSGARCAGHISPMTGGPVMVVGAGGIYDGRGMAAGERHRPVEFKENLTSLVRG